MEAHRCAEGVHPRPSDSATPPSDNATPLSTMRAAGGRANAADGWNRSSGWPAWAWAGDSARLETAGATTVEVEAGATAVEAEAAEAAAAAAERRRVTGA